MARSRIVINGVTGSYFEASVGSQVQLNNDGDGDETAILWVSLTGSQPSGSYDGFSDPISFSPTITLRKEGNYLVHNIVDNDITLTGSAVIVVRHEKSDLQSPAAGERTERDSEFGWARAQQLLTSIVDDLIGQDAFVVGRAKQDLTRGDVVRPTGSFRLKLGLPGEENVLEFSRISGEPAESFRGTLYVVEGTALTGSSIGISGSVPEPQNPTSGSLFIARRQGLFGPVTGSATIGDPAWIRSDGALTGAAETSTSRKIGHVVNADPTAPLFYVYFDGGSMGRMDVQVTGSEFASDVTAIDFSGSGVTVTVSEGSAGKASVGISAHLLDVQVTGSEFATDVTVIDFSGSGADITVSESAPGTASVVISPKLIDVFVTGSEFATDITAIDFSGSGANISVSESASGTASIGIETKRVDLFVTSSLVATDVEVIDLSGSNGVTFNITQIGATASVDVRGPVGSWELIGRADTLTTVSEINITSSLDGKELSLDQDKEWALDARLNVVDGVSQRIRLNVNETSADFSSMHSSVIAGGAETARADEWAISHNFTSIDETHIDVKLSKLSGSAAMFRSACYGYDVATEGGNTSVSAGALTGIDIFAIGVKSSLTSTLLSGSVIRLYRRVGAI